MVYQDVDGIRESFAAFLCKNARYSKADAAFAVSDFPSMIENCFLDQKYIGAVDIDGVEYEQRATWTNFIETGMVNTKGKTFCFYMFYRVEDVANSTVREYENARKLFSITDLDPTDFPWYVKW